jgi:hypothetical protein
MMPVLQVLLALTACQLPMPFADAIFFERMLTLIQSLAGIAKL